MNNEQVWRGNIGAESLIPETKGLVVLQFAAVAPFYALPCFTP
jgi:hypothetical protein